jgi:hypothetical protein
MGCSEKSPIDDWKFDLEWKISRGSGMIQLGKLLPLDVLYPEAHGAGCIGGLWKKHHKALADFINMFDVNSVFEIGGAHGLLAKEFINLKRVPWTIVEPNPMVGASDPSVKFIKGFFNSDFRCSEPFDAIVHSHVFEHIYEPDEFSKQLAGFCGEGKFLIFSVPNLQIMLERKFTNHLNPEHTVFLTEPYIEYLAGKHGFHLLKREYFLEDHSIFYAFVRDSSSPKKSFPTGLYKKNKKLYEDYILYHKQLVREINKKISSCVQPIFLFGAHVFSQFLIAFGLDTKHLVCIIDNDSNKNGKRLYGTNLFVKSPKVLQEVENPKVILRAGVFNAEIKKEILENINAKAEFWE